MIAKANKLLINLTNLVKLQAEGMECNFTKSGIHQSELRIILFNFLMICFL